VGYSRWGSPIDLIWLLRQRRVHQPAGHGALDLPLSASVQTALLPRSERQASAWLGSTPTRLKARPILGSFVRASGPVQVHNPCPHMVACRFLCLKQNAALTAMKPAVVQLTPGFESRNDGVVTEATVNYGETALRTAWTLERRRLEPEPLFRPERPCHPRTLGLPNAID
jgi:hypothetical protein